MLYETAQIVDPSITGEELTKIKEKLAPIILEENELSEAEVVIHNISYEATDNGAAITVEVWPLQSRDTH